MGASQQDDLVVLDRPPPELGGQLLVDAMRVRFQREADRRGVSFAFAVGMCASRGQPQGFGCCSGLGDVDPSSRSFGFGVFQRFGSLFFILFSFSLFGLGPTSNKKEESIHLLMGFFCLHIHIFLFTHICMYFSTIVLQCRTINSTCVICNIHTYK